MNILTKNRIIEKGDEYRYIGGEWAPVPEKLIGLQVTFSGCDEVRRPSEEPLGTVAREISQQYKEQQKLAQPDELPAGVGVISKELEKHPAHPSQQIEVDYTDLRYTPVWIGRNGTFKATGLMLQRLNPSGIIQIRPKGKRGLAKNALIEIPEADLVKICKWLEQHTIAYETQGLDNTR